MRQVDACGILACMTTKTLKLAMDRAAELPKQAQEEIAREVLERVNGIAYVRAAIEIGVRQLDAGMGRPLDLGRLMRRTRTEYETEK